MSRIIFISLFALLLIGVSLFIAKIYSAGFRESHPGLRHSTLPAILLPLVYILSFIAVRETSSGLGIIAYWVTNVLGGILFNLFIGALILGIVMIFYSMSGNKLPVVVPWTLFSIAIIFSMIGFVQARFIKTVEYTVAIPNLPASWENKKAVLVTDTHFGIINRKNFSNKVVDKIISLKPDLVLHAGDFYDGPNLDTQPITKSWKRLTAVAPVFYAPGNHETYGNYEKFMTSVKDAGVVLLEDSKTTFEGLQIAGLKYRDKGMGSDAATALSSMKLDPGTPTLLINHPPTFQKEAKDAEIDMMVSGHTHRGQFWPMNYIVRLVYGKYTYGLQEYNGMPSLVTSGVGTFGPPSRLFNTPEVVIINFKTK